MTTTRIGTKTATPVLPTSCLPASVRRHRKWRRGRPRRRLEPGFSLSTPTTVRPSISKRFLFTRRTLRPDRRERVETSTGRHGPRRPVSFRVDDFLPWAAVPRRKTNASQTKFMGLRPTAVSELYTSNTVKIVCPPVYGRRRMCHLLARATTQTKRTVGLPSSPRVQ